MVAPSVVMVDGGLGQLAGVSGSGIGPQAAAGGR